MADTFISYSSKDRDVAAQICHGLEQRGIRCWIAPRDVCPGSSYAEALIDAISASKVFLLLLSPRSNGSGHVEREVERAVAKGTKVLPFEIETVPELSKKLEYFIAETQRIIAAGRELESHFDEIANSIRRLGALKGSAAGTRSDARAAESGTSQPEKREVSKGRWERREADEPALWLEILRENSRGIRCRISKEEQAEAPDWERIEIPERTHSRMLETLARLGSRSGDDAEQSAALGALLFEALPGRVREALQSHRGPLHLNTEDLELPWELLKDSRGFLILRQPFARQPRMLRWADSLLGSEASFEQAGMGRALIIADPQGELPAAAREARALEALFASAHVDYDSLVGLEPCGYGNVMARLARGDYAIVHFAGKVVHFPERHTSALLLANDQWLTAEEICGALRGNPLVFINGCLETGATLSGATPAAGSQSIRTLVQAFIHGNLSGRAKAVVGSTWWLGSDVATGIAANFYRHLLKGRSLGDSLRRARQQGFDSGMTADSWGRYVLFGESSAALVGVGDVTAGTSPPGSTGDPLADLSDGLPWSDVMRVALLGALSSMRQMGWSFLSTLHMVLGLTYAEAGILFSLLKQRGLDPPHVRRALRDALSEESGERTEDFQVSENLAESLKSAQRLAAEASEGQVEERHFLRALLDRESAIAPVILELLGIDRDELRRGIAALPPTPLFSEDGSLERAAFTEHAWSALEVARDAALAGRWLELRSPHVFLGALERPESALQERLRGLGVDPNELGRFIHHATSQPPESQGRRPRLHRDDLSEAAREALTRARSLTAAQGAARISEDALIRAIVLDEMSFVARALRSRGLDPARLVLH